MNQSCALLDLKLDSDEMLAAANLLEEHHGEFQKIEGRKTDPGEWNISVVAERDYIGVSAYGPWGWSLLSIDDHVYVCEGGAWEDVEAGRGAGRIFRSTLVKIGELLGAEQWVFMPETVRDSLESEVEPGASYDVRRSWLEANGCSFSERGSD